MATDARRKVRWYGLFSLFTFAVISLFSALPGAPTSGEPPLWYVVLRKLAHVGEFAVLSFFLARTLGMWRPAWPHARVGVLVLLIVGAAGILDETHQSFTFGRSPRVYDVGIDLAGGLLGWTIACVLRDKKRSGGV